MSESREQFDSELSDLEQLVQHEAVRIRISLGRAVDMLQSGSPTIAAEIIAADDPIDLLYIQVERDVASIWGVRRRLQLTCGWCLPWSTSITIWSASATSV